MEATAYANYVSASVYFVAIHNQESNPTPCQAAVRIGGLDRNFL